MQNVIISLCRLIGRVSWIKFGIRFRIIKALLGLFHVKDFSFNVDFHGMNYQGETQNYIDWCVYYFGYYEEGLLKLIEAIQYKIEGKTFIDIGANIGQHSLWASKFFDKVVSFEPFYLVRQELEKKVQENNLDHICVQPYGLSLKNETITFYAPDDANLGVGSFIPRNGEQMQLEVKKADDYIKTLGLNQIDVIKIDVEGFERNVIEGLSQTIKEHQPLIIMEFCPHTRKSFENLEKLKSFFPKNYQIKAIYNANARRYKLGTSTTFYFFEPNI